MTNNDLDQIAELRREIAQLRKDFDDLREGQVDVLVKSINTGNADVMAAIRRRIRMSGGNAHMVLGG